MEWSWLPSLPPGLDRWLPAQLALVLRTGLYDQALAHAAPGARELAIAGSWQPMQTGTGRQDSGIGGVSPPVTGTKRSAGSGAAAGASGCSRGSDGPKSPRPEQESGSKGLGPPMAKWLARQLSLIRLTGCARSRTARSSVLLFSTYIYIYMYSFIY